MATTFGNSIKSTTLNRKMQLDFDIALQHLTLLAVDNGFELLETKWLGSQVKHRFKRIDTGSIYTFVPKDIKIRGFPKNVRTQSERLNEISVLAKNANFELLATEWLGSHTKHPFKNTETSKIHEWSPHQLLAFGFPKNLPTKTKIERYQELTQKAKTNGFELLEKEWLGNGSKHRFKHLLTGQIYVSKADNILARGFPKDIRTHAERFRDLSNFAHENGFELLESKWLGVKIKHLFKHIDSGELYEGTPDTVYHKNGFPLSGGQRFLTEEICRQALSHIFGGAFKIDNKRLRHIHGKHIQLDGFEHFPEGNPFFQRTLNIDVHDIAFEYQGHPSHFNDIQVMRRDKLRVQYCNELGIKLIVIGPLPDRNKVRDPSYVYDHVCKAIRSTIPQLKLSDFKSTFEIDLRNWTPDLDNFKKLKTIAFAGGFELLNHKWEGQESRYKFQYVETGDIYEWQGRHIMVRGFPKDLRTDQHLYDTLRLSALQNGFELLEKKWLGSAVKHQFKHISSDKVYTGQPARLTRDGFPKDLRTDTDKLAHLASIGLEHGFELLDPIWRGVKEKYNFKHTHGGKLYQFTADSIFTNKKFPADLRTYDDKLHALSSFAMKHGFELLENEWLGVKEKHRFKHIDSGAAYSWTPDFLNRSKSGFPKHRPDVQAAQLSTLTDTPSFGI
jgi:hypothetical protein